MRCVGRAWWLRRLHAKAERAKAERAKAERAQEFVAWAMQLKGRLVAVKYRETTDTGYSESFGAAVTKMNYCLRLVPPLGST